MKLSDLFCCECPAYTTGDFTYDIQDYLDFCDLMFDEFVECLRTLEYDNYLADQLTAIKIDDIWERSVESVCDKNTIEKIRNKRIQIRREVFIDG